MEKDLKPGEWVKCIHKQKSGRITLNGLYKVCSHVSGVVKLDDPSGEDSGSYSDAFFRKATVEEITAHFSKKEEPKPEPAEEKEWEPAFGEEVQGRLKNGKYVLGNYIEPSQMFSLHYVEEKYAKDIYQCTSVEPIPKVTVELGLLLQMYAEPHNIDPSQIIVK